MFVVLLSSLLSATLAVVKEGKNLKLKENLEATRKKRQEYINWVIHRVIAPATAADEQLIKPITNLLAETLSGIFKGHQSQKKVPDKQETYMNKLLFRELLFAFPKDWRERLMDHSEIRSFFGSSLGPAITLGKLEFEPSKFWNAIQQVLSGQSISLRTRDESAAIRLEVVSTAYDDFKLKSTGALIAHLDDVALLIASSSKEQQLEVLEKHSDWIDREKIELAKTISDITQEPDPMHRMQLSWSRFPGQFGSEVKVYSGF